MFQILACSDRAEPVNENKYIHFERVAWTCNRYTPLLESIFLVPGSFVFKISLADPIIGQITFAPRGILKCNFRF